MSAAALMQWLGENMPEVQTKARAQPTRSAFVSYMAEVSGWMPLWSIDHDAACAFFLGKLKEKHPSPIRTRPAPQLPPEVWNTRKVDATEAMAAVRAMCRGAS